MLKKTRKSADIIIPRGAENTIAIDLIVGQLKLAIKKFDSNTLMKEESIGLISTPIDKKQLFYPDKINIPTNKDELETLELMINDVIHGKRICLKKLISKLGSIWNIW